MMTTKGIYNKEFLDIKRQSGDRVADEFIKYVFSDNDRKLQLQQWLTGKFSIAHLDEMFPGFDFISQSRELPLWAKPELIQEGNAFFARHAQNIMSLLGLLSLPYCYTAADGAMVLYLSEKIRKNTTKRLYDTAVFVWEVMGPAALSKSGNGFNEILKVRIVHAAIRFYTLQSGKWNEKWGMPINQEDMAGTNLSFSLIVVHGLRKLGITISNREQIAFLHLWKVIGYLTGLDEDLLPENGRMATQLDLVIKNRQFRISDHGRELTNSLIEHILTLNRRKVSNNDILGLMRNLLGNDVADMLNIQAPELPKYKLTLIRTINFFKGFKLRGDSVHLYHQAYAAFKKQSLHIQQ
ncbi:oxygenase MpaB family protein [Pedobacter rhodius]|uniref:Oxygenase MpaB family protein n=1 Tax=Pedobacter rhodius TaxID=3004098 RepID=A0ABT4L0U7_9SPHI|nr:oxygenase MpaB family protein [Pedobacter sp. SJ11]MCZ4224805.1 oxygenase MpaB family protein [Pedobacter sp. SJ11]